MSESLNAKIINNVNSEKFEKDIAQLLHDVKLVLGNPKRKNISPIVRTERRGRNPVLHYNTAAKMGRTQNTFHPPMHDLSEVARAIDTEALLARSIQKHREIILKEGHTMFSKNREVLDYVKNRLREFEFVTGVTTESVIRDITTNLVSFSTAFLVKKRDSKRSTGYAYRRHGKRLEPIAGIFPMDPTSTLVEQNKAGRPIRWKQEIDGQEVFHNADDVIDITIDRKSGFVYGTPYCVPVLDDIRALRRLEELVELITSKWLFPLFQYTVGTDEMPASYIELPDGTQVDEVDIVRAQIQEMPTEGGIVTPHTHAIQLIGAEGQVLDINQYLAHFQNRVMMGLRLSGIDVGQGDTANRGTAQVMNKNMVDAVKDFQCVIADQITAKLFDELVLEGGYDLNEENRVYFRFPTPDREELRAQQNHGTALFQSSLITIDEFRIEYLNKEPLTDEELAERTYYGLFEKPMQEMNAELDMAKIKVAAAKGGGSAGGSSSSSSSTTKSSPGPSKAVTIKTNPENQFGRLPTAPRFPKNDYMGDVLDAFDSLKTNYLRTKDLKTEYDKFSNRVSASARRFLRDYIDMGLDEAAEQLGIERNSKEDKFYERFFLKTVKNDLLKLNRQFNIVLSQSNDNAAVMATFDTYEIRLKFFSDRHLTMAYRYGFISTCKDAGCDKIYISQDDVQQEVKLKDLPANTLGIDKMPGFDLQVQGSE